jgi:hypothetical protein
MTRKDGKKLEKLVAEIEEIAARDGKSIEINKKFYNDSGVQVAEFDILITFASEVGENKWLIECRDRPSDGTAPVSWIEQLIGRKTVHELNRVIAVSTTGFSPGAIDCASKGCIELRTVNDAEMPEKWLCNVVTVLKRTGDFKDCKVNLRNDLNKDTVEYVTQNMPSNADGITLFFETLNTRSSPRELFQNLCFDDQNSIYEDISPGKSKSIHLVFSPDTTATGVMFMEFDNFKVPLESIEFFGEVRIEMNTVPFDETKVYKQNGKQGFIGQRIICSLAFNRENIKFYLYDVEVEDGRQIAMKMNNEPKSFS